ncbi:hypothetical protein BDZ89DRAFT_1159624 [Hymenopellis radicata]|nr:hypothetical protein BDZ89DRAFT_1159624 [Hymenopellis radicata]
MSAGLFPPSASSPLEMFLTGTPVHTHQMCQHCKSFRRCAGHGSAELESFKLSQCVNCRTAKYCSKECQRADWRNHKLACKKIEQDRQKLAAETGIASAYDDVQAWLEYYNTPLKNCAIASYRLVETPHMEKDAMFMVVLSYDGRDPRPHRKFKVDSVSRIGRQDFGPQVFALLSDEADRRHYEAMGRVEMGELYYGTGSYGVDVNFAQRKEPFKAIKWFSMDKYTARATLVRQDWFRLFREYVDTGSKMSFCCGKLEGWGTCCCGGWTHDKKRVDDFRKAESKDLPSDLDSLD